MIFMIGGEACGQEEYAREHFPGARILGNYHRIVREQIRAGEDPLVRAEELLKGGSTDGEKDRISEEAGGNPAGLVVWSCEIGCGLVPMDPEDREWRELSGRVNCYFAEQAETVIRMVCGIGTVIKENSRSVKSQRAAERSQASAERSQRYTVKNQSSEEGCRISAERSRTSSADAPRRAKPVMVTGTMSNAGKSLVAAGLCRIFTEDGYRVAPFKAQNMALNSFITSKGEEMGRSQVVQAEACRREPDARMNPILLKPTTDRGSQIIVMGHPLADMDAKEYYRRKNELLPYVREAYESLAAENDIIVLEGAGSPAEINLKENDIVNMPMAAMADAPVILVGNIDPGGVFAQLYGTVKLLEPEEQDRIRGLIINKFRGDLSILEPGIGMLEEKTGKKVLGVIPYLDVCLEPEDSLALDEREQKEKREPGQRDVCPADGRPRPAAASGEDGGDRRQQDLLDIAVIRLPKISNFTDFEALRLEPDVRLRYVHEPGELGTPDMIILPGTKSTIADLLWLRQSGLETMIRRACSRGTFLMGICGGYQMLGTRISDPDGAERQGETAGLGVLDMTTLFTREKIMRQTETVSRFGIEAIDGKKITGYEVHMGREEQSLPGREEHTGEDTHAAGKASAANGSGEAGGNVIGTYIHGIFDEDEFRSAFLGFLYGRRGEKRRAGAGSGRSYREYREEQLDRVAAVLRERLDMAEIRRIMGLPPAEDGRDPEVPR